MSINKISPLFFFALVVSYVRVWPAPSSAKPQLDVTTRPWYHYIKEETPETKIPQINHFKLSNGIGVYFYPADAVPLVTAQIFIDGGGFEVADDKLGLQTLWGDTVVFSGSETMGRDTLSSYLEERASKFNFNAELDRSSFNVQSLAHYFEKDLRTLFSVIENPRFENNDFELLRTRLVKSLEKRDEDPSKWAALGLSQVYWKNTLRGRYATIRTVKNIAREDLTLWQKKLWRAERLTIAVSGSIDEKRLKTLLEETFGKMPYDKTQKADLSRLHVEPTFKPNSLYVLPKEIPQTTVLYK
ncbi:MAG TPA: insulinase family protein, partial [Turneriella sp.]|nr:insulinase family protein [Turneriella sp.]